MADLNETMWNLVNQPIKALYLHYYIAYCHQTWQGGDLAWGAPTDKVTWPFDHVVLGDYVAILKHISATRVPVATKLSRMVIYLEGLLPIELLHPLVMWPC